MAAAPLAPAAARCTLHAAWCSSCLAPLAPGVVRDQAVCTRRAARVVRGGDPLRVGALELQAKPDIRFSFALLCPQGCTLRRPNARSAMQCDATRCDLHARQAYQTALPLPRLLCRSQWCKPQTCATDDCPRAPLCVHTIRRAEPSRAEPGRAGRSRAIGAGLSTDRSALVRIRIPAVVSCTAAAALVSTIS